MASEKTDAIVLRVVNWSETSCIVTLLTRDFGLISGLAKGARRLKSPFESALYLLALCRIVFIPKAGDVLDLLTEAKLVRRFRPHERDLICLYSGYYVAELLLGLTETSVKTSRSASNAAFAEPRISLKLRFAPGFSTVVPRNATSAN